MSQISQAVSKWLIIIAGYAKLQISPCWTWWLMGLAKISTTKECARAGASAAEIYESSENKSSLFWTCQAGRCDDIANQYPVGYFVNRWSSLFYAFSLFTISSMKLRLPGKDLYESSNFVVNFNFFWGHRPSTSFSVSVLLI